MRHRRFADGDIEQPGRPRLVEIDTLHSTPLNMGAGYVGDPACPHGRWMGRAWSESV